MTPAEAVRRLKAADLAIYHSTPGDFWSRPPYNPHDHQGLSGFVSFVVKRRPDLAHSMACRIARSRPRALPEATLDARAGCRVRPMLPSSLDGPTRKHDPVSDGRHRRKLALFVRKLLPLVDWQNRDPKLNDDSPWGEHLRELEAKRKAAMGAAWEKW